MTMQQQRKCLLDFPWMKQMFSTFFQPDHRVMDSCSYSSRTSLNSLDNIIEPPDMFNESNTIPDGHYIELESSAKEPRSEQEPSRGTNSLTSKQGSATGLKRPVSKARSKYQINQQ